MYKNGQEDLLEENAKVRLYSLELKLKAVSAHLHDGRTLRGRHSIVFRTRSPAQTS